MNFKLFPIILLLSVIFGAANAQTSVSSDELFQQARTAAFDQKDYKNAIELSNQALTKAPTTLIFISSLAVFMHGLTNWIVHVPNLSWYWLNIPIMTMLL